MSRTPDLWLQTAPDLGPRPLPVDDADPVDWHEGRAYRRETARHDPKGTLTPEEQRLLGQRTREAAENRLAEGERALTTLVQLGEAFRLLREG